MTDNRAPFSSPRDSASGIAAPIVNRKNGKTRSTHVMPGRAVFVSCVGGGSCAWYIQAGSVP